MIQPQMKRIRQELIETLWNVNWNQGRLKERKEKELIETLWNVNLEKSVLIQYCDMQN